jgi:hypothetical protein
MNRHFAKLSLLLPLVIVHATATGCAAGTENPDPTAGDTAQSGIPEVESSQLKPQMPIDVFGETCGGNTYSCGGKVCCAIQDACCTTTIGGKGGPIVKAECCLP